MQVGTPCHLQPSNLEPTPSLEVWSTWPYRSSVRARVRVREWIVPASDLVSATVPFLKDRPATWIGTVQAKTRPASFRERRMVFAEGKVGASIYHALRVEIKLG